MSIKKSINLLAAFLALVVLPVAALAQTPQLPHLFYGGITINGAPAPVGTVVIAKVGGVEKGRVTTTLAGKYGGLGAYDQKLLVQGVVEPATITFSVDGRDATPTASFESGKMEKLDLAVNFDVPPPPPPPPDGGGGGGGGGSEAVITSPIPASPLSPAATRSADANRDGRVDILDFNLLMINWGSTSANNPADFNGDGLVNLLDLNSLMVNWTR